MSVFAVALFASFACSASRLTQSPRERRTNTPRPERSSALASGGSPGAVTRISLTLEKVGLAKSTCARRSGVLVGLSAARLGMASGRVLSRVIDASAGAHPKRFLGVDTAPSDRLLAALRMAL